MKTIYYPGMDRQPCALQYGICFSPEGSAVPYRTVIVYLRAEPSAQASLINSDESRNNVINRILENELAGIRLEFVRVIYHYADGVNDGLHAFEFPLDVDVDDFERRGNPVSVMPVDGPVTSLAKGLLGKPVAQKISFNTYNIVAGSARVFSDFEKRLHVDGKLLKAIFERLSIGEGE